MPTLKCITDVRERRENEKKKEKRKKQQQLEKKTNLYRSKNAAQFLKMHPLHFASGKLKRGVWLGVLQREGQEKRTRVYWV